MGALLAVLLTVFATVVMAHFDRFRPAAPLPTDCEELDALEEKRPPELSPQTAGGTQLRYSIMQGAQVMQGVSMNPVRRERSAPSAR